MLLLGRHRECGVLDGLLEDVRAGRSGAMVVRGEAGIGKTALLEYAIGSASDLRVARAAGVYREAVERLERSRGMIHATRARLLYGEWLRREKRRTDAREQLRVAYERFSRIGAGAFAERARGELLATGETVRKRRVDTRDDLTSQEKQIAQLARDGLSNPEIGARLFISARTVEYHLHKVFRKLGITSRTQLESALQSESAAA